MTQYLPAPLRPASLILSDHCPILQTPRRSLGENTRARVSWVPFAGSVQLALA
ncbi:hypothetical protein [Caballeronia sp. KNU42]